MSCEERLCQSCDIRSIQTERHEEIAEFAIDAIRQWWFGNPTLRLQDVVGDRLIVERPKFTNDEMNGLYRCASEHSSTRCDALNP